jgi:flavin-dependent dehydrogenase
VEKAVTIAGGGLAGLACGIRLLERGWAVTLHERQRYPLRKVCGEFLSPAGWARVQALGAEAHLDRPPLPLRSARFYGGPELSADFSLDPPAWGLSRAALDQALARRFQSLGGDLREGSEAPLDAPGLVLATGRPSDAGAGAWMGWKGYLAAADAPPELDQADLLMLPLPQGYAGLSRVEDGRVSLCLVARTPVRVAELFASHPLLQRVHPALVHHASIAGFSFTVRPGSGRIGDAHRVFPPVVGDGMSQALRGGEALAQRLDQGRGSWDWEAALRFQLALGLHQLMLWPGGRAAVVRLCKSRPWLAGRLYHWSRG